MLLLAAIFSQSTLLVHCNLQILLIIKIVMSVYENLPDSQKKLSAAYVMLYQNVSGSPGTNMSNSLQRYKISAN